MKKSTRSSSTLFYSRNPSKLKEDLRSVKDPVRVSQIVLDYEFKKSIDYGQLSQSLLNIKQFTNASSLYLNFGQCALNTQKLLLLLKGFTTIQPKLRQIYFIFENCSHFNEDTMENLCKFILEIGPNLTNLCLNLKKCNMGTKGAQILVQTVSELDLKFLSLNLESNEIQYDTEFGKTLTMMFDKQKNTKMVELILAHNEIQDSGLQDLSIALARLKQVTCLLVNLIGCQISDYGVEYLSKNIQNLSQLNTLYLCLDWNKIKEEGAEFMGQSFQKLVNLVSLNVDLDYNEIGANGVQYLADSLTNCIGLQNLHLNLAHNELGDEGLRQLGESLPNFVNIRNLQLELGWNKLGPESMKTLTQKIEKYKTLQSLNIFIDNNKIEDFGLSQISNCLLQLNNLMRLQLDLDDNEIGIESLKAIVTSLTGIPLKSLMINLVNNNVEQETLSSMAKYLKSNFPNLDTGNYSLKYGSERVLPMLNSKILQSSGLSQSLIRFCELTREKSISSTYLEINQKEFYSILEELLRAEIIQIVFDIHVSEQSSMDLGQGIEAAGFDNQISEQEAEMLQDLVSFEGQHPQQHYQQQRQNMGSRGQLTRPLKKSPERAPDPKLMKTKTSDRKSPPPKQSQLNQEDQRRIQQIMEPNSYEAVYYDLKQENMMLKRENIELKRRLGQRFEPDVVVPLEKYSNLDCKILPFTMNEFVQEVKLGVGTFGEVWLVSRGSQKFAQKTLEFDLKQRVNYVKDLRDFFTHVNDMVRSIRHENILYLYGLAFEITDQGVLRTHLVMELMHQDLRQYVKDNMNRNYDLNLKIMRDILDGLVYFQKNKIVHAALKPSNILIDQKYKAKISDIGIAKVVKIQLHVEGESTSVYGFAPKFSAPEIFDGREDETTDIWSFGCLLFYVFTGESPWAGLSEYQQLTVMLRRTNLIQHFKSTPVGQQIVIPPSIEAIIEKCTRYDSRPTPEEILKIFPTSLEHGYQKPQTPIKSERQKVGTTTPQQQPQVQFSESNLKQSVSSQVNTNQQQHQFFDYDPNEATKTAQKF